MTDSAEETIRKGRDAKYLLENEAFRDVVADLRAGTLLGWRTSRSDNTAARETMFFQMQAIDAIEARLTARVESAKLEADRLEKAARRTSRQA